MDARLVAGAMTDDVLPELLPAYTDLQGLGWRAGYAVSDYIVIGPTQFPGEPASPF